jgi:predicted RNase H-like nuclease (RuvC/YqgF family)
MSRKQRQSVVIAFDPGATTGIAVVNARNQVMYTAAVSERTISLQAKRIRRKYKDAPVAIETGPLWRSNSNLTRNVEQELRNIFPSAALIRPNQWKSHPAAECNERLHTTHERDAVRLARWFIAKGVTDNAERQNEDATDTDST